MPIPAGAETITYPAELGVEVDALCGGWRDDLPDFRTRARDELYADLVALTDQHFLIARDWARRDDWDLLVFVTVVPDRVHHVFWGEPTPPEIPAYYRHLDAEVGALLARLRPDDVVMVVSDHGAQTNHGYFALNEFLRRRGDLILRAEPTGLTPFAAELVDWPRTRAWADGGYVGRIYVNLRDREPQGLLPAAEVEAYLAALARDLAAVPGADGAPWHNRALRPCQLFAGERGVPPELFVVFDRLRIRALGSLGHSTLYPRDNDRGPDAANHAPHGICILRDGGGPRAAPADLTLYDVAPTLLAHLGLEAPAGLRGRAVGG
jgi:predicted AlkP superfamily phosphohydrolase/phosphomutase